MGERKRVVTLSAQQQLALEPFVLGTLRGFGIDEYARGAIFVEGMSKMSPAMSLSEMATLNVLSKEVERYEEDPLLYNLTVEATLYEILSLAQPPLEGLGRAPSFVEGAFLPSRVPSVDQDWLGFAERIEGHRIAHVLDLELADLGKVMRGSFKETDRWSGTLLDLRLMLFFEAAEFRRIYHSVEVPGYHGYISSLLQAIDAKQQQVPGAQQDVPN